MLELFNTTQIDDEAKVTEFRRHLKEASQVLGPKETLAFLMSKWGELNYVTFSQEYRSLRDQLDPIVFLELVVAFEKAQQPSDRLADARSNFWVDLLSILSKKGEITQPNQPLFTELLTVFYQHLLTFPVQAEARTDKIEYEHKRFISYYLRLLIHIVTHNPEFGITHKQLLEEQLARMSAQEGPDNRFVVKSRQILEYANQLHQKAFPAEVFPTVQELDLYDDITTRKFSPPEITQPEPDTPSRIEFKSNGIVMEILSAKKRQILLTHRGLHYIPKEKIKIQGHFYPSGFTRYVPENPVHEKIKNRVLAFGAQGLLDFLDFLEDHPEIPDSTMIHSGTNKLFSTFLKRLGFETVYFPRRQDTDSTVALSLGKFKKAVTLQRDRLEKIIARYKKTKKVTDQQPADQTESPPADIAAP